MASNLKFYKLFHAEKVVHNFLEWKRGGEGKDFTNLYNFLKVQ